MGKQVKSGFETAKNMSIKGNGQKNSVKKAHPLKTAMKAMSPSRGWNM